MEQKTKKLEKYEELRILIANDDSKLTLKVTKGECEIFGNRLINNKEYNFESEQGFSVGCMKDCEININIKGNIHIEKTKDNCLKEFESLYKDIEVIRNGRKDDGNLGPRVMIVGKTDVGKSTLTKILLNYSVNNSLKPLYVDLDVGQSELSIPGTMASTIVDGNLFGNVEFNSPLIWWYGHSSPSASVGLFKECVGRSAKKVLKHLSEQKECEGCFINTCGWVEGLGYSLLMEIAKAYKVDMFLVLDNPELSKQIAKEKLKDVVSIIDVSKSTAVKVRSSAYRRNARKERIKQYFYGSDGKFQVHKQVLNLSDVELVEMGKFNKEKRSLGDKVVPILSPGKWLIDEVLAISYADIAEHKDVVKNTCAGFVKVTGINLNKGTIIVETCSKDTLPSHILVKGSIKMQ